MKIAIYGGAFNPVHLGHIQIVKALVNKYDFDKILIIPSFISPHKSNAQLIAPEHRLNMCKLAFSDIEKCEVCDIELKLKDVSYTINTLAELKKIYKNDKFYLICGSDMFLSLEKWKQPIEIFKKTNIIAFIRDGEPISNIIEYSEKLKTIGAKVEICKVEILPYSSTQIRNAILNGDNYEQYLKNDVYEYIIKNRLYKE